MAARLSAVAVRPVSYDVETRKPLWGRHARWEYAIALGLVAPMATVVGGVANSAGQNAPARPVSILDGRRRWLTGDGRDRHWVAFQCGYHSAARTAAGPLPVHRSRRLTVEGRIWWYATSTHHI